MWLQLKEKAEELNIKYVVKIITLFFDSSKRTELYKSGRTIAYHPANTILTNGGI